MSTFIRLDAQNRSLRTLIQNLAFDVLAAVGLVIYQAFNSTDNWGSLDWKFLAFTLVKTAVVTAFSYIMRTVIDPSKIPTPLPPVPPITPVTIPVTPVVPNPPEGGYVPTWLAVLVGILVILAILFLLGIRVTVG